ncbi:hypothetical protein [Actinoplanes sp. TFC3]|uniref:hypothetical protein n=1 Tax=Actinoplanes sp. TFC3 TaxID=1710355 RepID=UPI0008351E10|nr:hypothetical protein [Actinoplanes sp. TFC3]
MPSHRLHRRRLAPVAAAVLAGLLGSGAMMLGASYATFTSTTDNTGNTVSAGTVVLGDDDSGTSMFTTGTPGSGQTAAADLAPGASVSNCVRVSYTGSVGSQVRLYSDVPVEVSPNGTGLASYLHVKVEEGTAGGFGCGGFTATGVVYDTTRPAARSDLLDSFPETYADAATVGPAAWGNGDSRVYKFTISVDSAIPDTSQGASLTVAFRWQARSQ